MVSECSNPGCGKPLHYLREGRIFLFEVTRLQAEDADGNLTRLEHFWLCGPCSEKFQIEKNGDGHVNMVQRGKSRRPAPVLPEDARMAS